MDPFVTDISTPLDLVTSLGFYLMLLFYIIFSAIFHYHWKEYATEETVTRTTLTLYCSTTVPLLLILGIVSLII